MGVFNWKICRPIELQLAEYTGASSVVLVVNGTAALQIALTLSGVKHNEEVIVPALSFVATANAVSHVGAIPNFVDVSKDTLGMCPVKLRNYLKNCTEKTPLAGEIKTQNVKSLRSFPCILSVMQLK